MSYFYSDNRTNSLADVVNQTPLLMYLGFQQGACVCSVGPQGILQCDSLRLTIIFRVLKIQMQITTSGVLVLNNKRFCLESKGGKVYFLHWFNTEDSPNLRITCIVLFQPRIHTA